MIDEFGIEYEGGYNPSNPVHNPAGYLAAVQEVERDVRKESIKAMRERLKDRPGYFAKLHIIYWIIIVALCFFVGYLLALV